MERETALQQAVDELEERAEEAENECGRGEARHRRVVSALRAALEAAGHESYAIDAVIETVHVCLQLLREPVERRVRVSLGLLLAEPGSGVCLERLDASFQAL